MELIFPPPPPWLEPLVYPSERLRWACEILGWTPGALAKRLNINETSARDWWNERRNIPAQVGPWLEALIVPHLEFPLPDNWGNPSRPVHPPQLRG